jgi:hypothetical protein
VLTEIDADQGMIVITPSPAWSRRLLNLWRPRAAQDGQGAALGGLPLLLIRQPPDRADDGHRDGRADYWAGKANST